MQEGREGEIAWEEEWEEVGDRKSRDEIENREGRELLRIVEEKGRVILNGNKEGDYEGRWTWERGESRSVIDYRIVNMKMWDKIKEFKVVERVDSDHHPIIIGLEGRREERDIDNERREEI